MVQQTTRLIDPSAARLMTTVVIDYIRHRDTVTQAVDGKIRARQGWVSTPAPPDPGDRRRWEIGRFMVDSVIGMNPGAPGWFPGPVRRLPTGPDGKERNDDCI